MLATARDPHYTVSSNRKTELKSWNRRLYSMEVMHLLNSLSAINVCICVCMHTCMCSLRHICTGKYIKCFWKNHWKHRCEKGPDIAFLCIVFLSDLFRYSNCRDIFLLWGIIRLYVGGETESFSHFSLYLSAFLTNIYFKETSFFRAIISLSFEHKGKGIWILYL